jgi:hypothetical protein
MIQEGKTFGSNVETRVFIYGEVGVPWAHIVLRKNFSQRQLVAKVKALD